MIPSIKTQVNDTRIYNTPFGKFPSVTSIIGLLDRSGPLCGWVAKETALYYNTVFTGLKADTRALSEYDTDKIIKDGKNCWRKLSSSALDIGTRTHHLIEQHIQGEPYEIPEDLAKPMEAFLAWQKQYNFEFLESELTLCMEGKYGFAGTLDTIAKHNNKIYIIDFKTSSAIRDEYPIQIAAYKYAIEHGKIWSNLVVAEDWRTAAYKIDVAGILRLDKVTGLPEWKTYTKRETAQALKVFKKLCALWYEKDKLDKLLK